MMDRCVVIGNKTIGPGHPVYIVFEAGPTQDGIETAKKLVDVAVEAGADAIKFQILNADKLVSSSDVMFTYGRLVDKESGETEEVTEPLLHILKRRELTFTEWEEVINYSKDNNIEFFSTATNEEELAFLADNKVQSVKICSGDVNYFHFIRQAARNNFSLQLDTGSSTLGEIEAAVDVIEKEGSRDIILNHCPSGYPARLKSINLQVIPTLSRMFPYPIAFSDHSPGYDMDIAAVSMGASMIEKTITLDKTIRSPEHIMSLEPYEAASFIRKIRELEVALGNNRRLVSDEEFQKRNIARRSLFATRDLLAGETLTQEMIVYSRPGDGIPANLDTLVIGKKIKNNILKSSKLQFTDFE
jgi:sialic acid synthase SpsE